MSRKWSTLVLLLLVTPLMALAQNTGKLSGRVLDATTNEPLPGANVVLEGTQLGTITDVDGNYFVIGIPAGTYNVRASFVGYQAQIVANVEINAGYTREQNFALTPGVELNEIVVEYERPLIQKDAIGSPKVVTAEEIQNMPVRGVTNVAALQGGVVANEGEDDLFVRGGRAEEVAYYVDGVKVTGGVNALGVPQQAIQEQEMLMGSIPARYGDVMSGVISITTKSGAQNFFGTAEAITSQVLDDFGYNLGSITLGGPIARNKLSFFISGQGTFQDDATPYAINTVKLPESELQAIYANPQVLQLKDGNGNINYVPLPVGDQMLAAGTPAQMQAELFSRIKSGQLGFLYDDAAFDTTQMSVSRWQPINRPDVYTSNRFETIRGKKQPERQYDLTGNFTINPTQSVSVRLGGAVAHNSLETFNYDRSLYDRDQVYNNLSDSWRVFGTWRQYLSNSTFYQLQAEYTDDRFTQSWNAFSNDVRETLNYGDIDSEVNRVLANYYNYQQVAGVGTSTTADDKWGFVKRPTVRDGATTAGSVGPGTFLLPGVVLDDYTKSHDNLFRVSANATTQAGLHQIEFGGEFERRTERYFRNVQPAKLAQWVCDDSNAANCGAEAANPAQGLNGVNSYEELPWDAMRPLTTYYGYDYLGLKEVNDQNIDDWVAETNLNIAPYQPYYYAGYISDKIEYKDLVLSLGVRVDAFNNNAPQLRDPYALLPIVRVSDLQGATAPAGIPSDAAVYYEGTSDKIVGYRDIDGNFFDANGQESSYGDLNKISGRPRQKTDAKFSEVFEKYKTQFTFMPRIGVSFPVTDQALFFASYNVTSQRPSEQQFTAFSSYQSVTGQNIVSNPGLKPEKTTQYELGFRQSLGARAALQISGFYRRQDNLIQIRSLNQVFPAGLQTYQNIDFAVTKGAEFEFDLRRINNLSLNANYTLSFAQGTGSDANSMQVIAWRSTLGGFSPNFVVPTAFDRRHSINLTADYRLGQGEGPEFMGGHPLQNFGVNLVANIGSGMPYTRLKESPVFKITEDFTSNVAGGINETRLPWTTMLNLRVDRQFQLSGKATATLFAWVQNLLDTENILGVYRSSGLPDRDGFLDSAEGQRQVEAAGNTYGDPRAAEAYQFHYARYANAPDDLGDNHYTGGLRYSLPRRVRLGVRLNF